MVESFGVATITGIAYKVRKELIITFRFGSKNKLKKRKLKLLW